MRNIIFSGWEEFRQSRLEPDCKIIEISRRILPKHHYCGLG
jgi:hypothetical protein